MDTSEQCTKIMEKVSILTDAELFYNLGMTGKQIFLLQPTFQRIDY